VRQRVPQRSFKIPLADLHPQWIVVGDRRGVGITFDCPKHGAECCRMQICFENPIDGDPVEFGANWKRYGTDLATLTITPSIDYVDHWHGRIDRGMVTVYPK
jgi:hypothetical protein